MSSPVILQVIPELNTGGAEKTALDIGAHLVAEGWTSLVASAGGRMLAQLEAEGSTHIDLPLASKNPLTLWSNANRLSEIIASHKVSLIHARSRAPAWSALRAARKTGIPFVTTYHGAYNQTNALKAFYNSVMARGDRVIANSRWTQELIEGRHPFAKGRITAIPRGTDFSVFAPDAITTDRVNALKQSWGIKEGNTLLLHLARITGWKGQRVVIDAASELIDDFPNLRVVLAGDAQGRDDYLEELNQRIAERGLQDRVLLPGHCDDPAAAMAAADLVVVASIEAEAFGRAAVEAGALEKPVVVTRIGAVSETVCATPEFSENERTGWKVEPGDAEDMAQALRQVLEMSPEQRHAIGARARSHGVARFSLETMCNQTLEVYRDMLHMDAAGR